MLHKFKRADKRRKFLVALGFLVAFCPCVYALDPALDVNQYAHSEWKVGEGFSKGIIRALAQSPDGYLWLGTEFGLLRFDGVQTIPWQPPPGAQLPSTDIRSLQAAHDGQLWIGTFTGLASWKDGRLTRYPQLDGQVIESLLEDREGTIWVAGWSPAVGRLCRIQSDNVQCYGEDGRLGNGVTPLYEDSRGNLWAGASNGLWRWKPGPAQLYPMPDPAQRIYSLAEGDDGGILVAKRSGITELKNGKAEVYPLPAGLPFQPFRLLRDRHGSLWVGAIVDSGLLHIHDGRVDLFSRGDGLSSGSISALIEDREGNIWVATGDGLDKFRDFSIPTFSEKQGFSSSGVSSILAARDGSLWLGTSDGLDRWDKGQITVYRKERATTGAGAPIDGPTLKTTPVREISDGGLPNNQAQVLFQDERGQVWVGTQSGVAVLKADRFVSVPSIPFGLVYSFAEGSGRNIWMSHQQGLFHLFGERVVEQIPWAKLGRNEPATLLLHDAVEGGFWLGFRDGGVAYFKEGRLSASYAISEGLGQGMIRDLYVDDSHTLWVSTEGGLSRIKDGRVATLTSRNGLPCDTVHWMREDDGNSVWLYTACGLLRVARPELDAWASQSKQVIQGTIFDNSNGVKTHRYSAGYGAVVAKAADGRLWFLPGGGVSLIDPRHLGENTVAPPVYIERITGDGQTYDATQGVRLPANVKDLAIDYTALSLVAPEKVQVRVKLEGQDNDWRVPVNPRHAHYTNLGPGTYRFRVIASNNSGVWNKEGAVLEFSIAPAFYQTAWFAVACGVLFLALLWLVYQFRVRQLAVQFNRTFEARVSERTRIARELHDTLLQSFQGLLLRFQSVLNVLPERPTEAKQRLQSAVDQAAAAITEGRDAVQGLRSSALETNELADGIRAIAEELTSHASAIDSPVIEVEVEGTTRALKPIVRDEAYRIAGEALRNAFRHAKAERITVEIRYDKRQFRLRIRDDGKGIDEDIMQRQPSGHFGLPGMRERAETVGAHLEVWTRRDSGTQVDLSIPGKIAYVESIRQS